MGSKKYCPNCGTEVPLDAITCPNCGHKGLVVKIVFEETISAKEQIRGRVKSPRLKRPKFEFKVGDDLYKKKQESGTIWNDTLIGKMIGTRKSLGAQMERLLEM